MTSHLHPTIPALEKRSIISLASLYIFRMLGLFMVLPVLVLYGDQYQGSTPVLLGLALGAYGITQAALQIPFGALSDRIGRKRVIAAGMLIFALGSVVAASAETIYGLIAGRCLQGAGAVAGAIMALVADSTSEQNRTKAMATIGASIGVAFAISMVLGPLVSQWGGLRSLFWLTAALAVLGLLILIFIVPEVKVSVGLAKSPGGFKRVLLNSDLLRLDLGVFVLHCVLMACFVAVPGLLGAALDLGREQQWQVYLPVVLLSFALMLPLIIIAEKKAKHKQVFFAGIALLFVSQLLFALFSGVAAALIVALLLFFVGFNVLEASLPSMLTKLAPVAAKGYASGVYSSSQFLGTFVGGACGGLMLSQFGSQGLFVFCALLLLAWLLLLPGMRMPAVTSVFVDVPVNELDGRVSSYRSLPGVREVLVVANSSCLHLRVDKRVFDDSLIKRAEAS